MRQGLNKHGTSGYHNPPGLERRPQVKIVRSFSQLHVLASITRIKCASLADTKVFENGCTRGRPMRIPVSSGFVQIAAPRIRRPPTFVATSSDELCSTPISRPMALQYCATKRDARST